MSKKKHKHRDDGHEAAVATAAEASGLPTSTTGSTTGSMAREDYEAQLHMLQVGLVKPQRHFIGCGDKILVLVEGRDAAWKDGGIRRVIEYLSPRETRVVALGKPSDRERRGWYFQRYVAHLPVAEEFVLFNRSWYNRAGVEQVMGLCSKDEQTRRLAQRKRDPLKQWKSSPVNAVAVKLGRRIPRHATRCCCERTPPSRHGTSCVPTTSASRV